MRRMARAVPLARARIDRLVNNLITPRLEIGPNIFPWLGILKRHLSEALDVLTGSVAAAHKCAEAFARTRSDSRAHRYRIRRSLRKQQANLDFAFRAAEGKC